MRANEMNPPSIYIQFIAITLQSFQCGDQPTRQQKKYCRDEEIDEIH